MHMSQHAAVRSQQRSISQMQVDLLMQFGTSQPAGDGASKLFFDKAARRPIRAYAGPLAGLLNEYLDVYAVVSTDDKIITAAHLIERIRRH
jgi:hypothetical protein